MAAWRIFLFGDRASKKTGSLNVLGHDMSKVSGAETEVFHADLLQSCPAFMTKRMSVAGYKCLKGVNFPPGLIIKRIWGSDLHKKIHMSIRHESKLCFSNSAGVSSKI